MDKKTTMKELSKKHRILYKVFMSYGDESDILYFEKQDDAELMFDRSIKSKAYDYVSIEHIECFTMKEWVSI